MRPAKNEDKHYQWEEKRNLQYQKKCTLSVGFLIYGSHFNCNFRSSSLRANRLPVKDICATNVTTADKIVH